MLSFCLVFKFSLSKMRVQFITGVIVFCCVAAAYAYPSQRCKYGVTGPKCSPKKTCGKGYTCNNGYCCKQPVCRPGWTKVGPCLHVPGQKRCPGPRDQCMNDICCRPPTTTQPCKYGTTNQRCSPTKPCRPGYKCTGGYCCRDLVCKPGWIEIGRCNNIPGKKRCPGQSDQCVNNVCCRPKTIEPPTPKCPKGMEQVPGSCPKETNTYMSYCPKGTTCHNGLCCQRYVIPAKCPIPRPPRVCPGSKDQCKTSYDCHKGDVCCKGPCHKFCYKLPPIKLPK
ncbi:hypothetical protein ACF0H5_006385 [Mactra antiquata]